MGIVYNTSIVRNGLVLHLDAANPKSYPGSGTTWFDLSGNGNDGTLVNSPTYTTNSHFSFNGINQYVSGNDLDLTTSSPTDSYHLDVWIYANVQSSLRGLLSLSSFNGLYISNIDIFAIQSNGDNSDDGVSTQIQESVWYHLAANYVESTKYEVFINGDLVHEVSTTDSEPDNATGYNIARRTTGGDYFDGNISGCKAYNRSLSPQEVKQNFEAHRNRYK